MPVPPLRVVLRSPLNELARESLLGAFLLVLTHHGVSPANLRLVVEPTGPGPAGRLIVRGEGLDVVIALDRVQALWGRVDQVTLAMVAAHEATHVVQLRRGERLRDRRTHQQASDPGPAATNGHEAVGSGGRSRRGPGTQAHGAVAAGYETRYSTSYLDDVHEQEAWSTAAAVLHGMGLAGPSGYLTARAGQQERRYQTAGGEAYAQLWHERADLLAPIEYAERPPAPGLRQMVAGLGARMAPMFRRP